MLSLWAVLAGALSSIPLHRRPAPGELGLFQGWAGAAAPGSRAGRCGGLSSCCREAPAPSRADTFLGFFWGLEGTSALLQLGDCDGAISVTPRVGRSPRAPRPSLIAGRDGQPPACEPGQPCCGVQRARLGLPAVLPVKGAEICRKAARAAWMWANQGPRGLGGSQALQKQGDPRAGPESGVIKIKAHYLPRLHGLSPQPARDASCFTPPHFIVKANCLFLSCNSQGL